MSPPHWGSGWPSAWILSKKSLLGSPGPPRGSRACDSKEAQGSPNTAQAYEDTITPFHCSGSTADVQLLPAQLQKHVLGHPAPLLHTCIPLLPQLAEKQDGPWLHKSHRSYVTPQKRCLTTHLQTEIRNCSEVISGQHSSLGTEMTEHLGPPLLTPLCHRVTHLCNVLAWPHYRTQSRQIAFPGGIVQLCRCSLVAWKISQWSGLGWVWKRAQVSLGELPDVVGNRFGTGHVWRAAVSTL